MAEIKSSDTQAEAVRKRIQQQISIGELLPGQRIEEIVLAERYGTSRTPVREALSQLVSSGLLQKSPRQGAVVTKLGVDELLSLMEYSAELAAACARFAARRLTLQDRKCLRDLCTNLESHIVAGDVAAYTADASRFHALIIEASHNHFLINAIAGPVVQLSPYYRFDLTYSGSLRRDLDDHWKILSAFDQADPDLSRALMRDHALLKADIIRDYQAFIRPTDAT